MSYDYSDDDLNLSFRTTCSACRHVYISASASSWCPISSCKNSDPRFKKKEPKKVETKAEKIIINNKDLCSNFNYVFELCNEIDEVEKISITHKNIIGKLTKYGFKVKVLKSDIPHFEKCNYIYLPKKIYDYIMVSFLENKYGKFTYGLKGHKLKFTKSPIHGLNDNLYTYNALFLKKNEKIQ
jgi:hypothetical protein